MYNLLIIEDNYELSATIADTLFEVGKLEQAYDGHEGLNKAIESQYDLIVLDLMLPKLSGLQLLAELRAQQIMIPVLILTAKGEIEDKVLGFQKGADDYLVKPFHREELLLRVKALLKRSKGLKEEMVHFYGLKCDLLRYEINYQNEILQLQGKTFDLLVYFMQNANIIVTKEQIFERIWGYDSDTAISVVEVYMSHLRKELKKVGIENWIRTIRNVGYILERRD